MKLVLAIVFLVALATVSAQNRVGTLYSMNSDPVGNSILAYPRYDDGTLGAPVLYSTGGQGAGDNDAPIPVGPHDALNSERGMITNRAVTRLYACNGKDNSVSVFSINKNDGSLTLLNIYDSGGEFPAALSLSPDESVLYILNNGAQGRLTAQPLNERVTFSNGRKASHVTIHQSTPTYPITGIDTLGTLAAAPTGKWVLVTEKLASTIKVFRVTRKGRLLPTQQYPPIVFNNDRAWSWSVQFYTPTDFLLTALNDVPRAFPIGPDSIVQSFRLNPNTGAITKLDQAVTFGGNVCWQVLFNGVWYQVGPTRAIIAGVRVNQNTGALTVLQTSETGLPTAAANVDLTYGGGDSWASPDGYFYINGQDPGNEDRITSPAFHVFKINANSTLTHTYSTTAGRPIQGAVGY